jgi:hypothetical protein
MSSQFTWALRIPTHEGRSLAELRTVPAVQVAVARDGIWLAGPALTPELDVQLRQLPTEVRYELTPQQQLRIPGERLLSGQLPEMVWLPLVQWVQPVIPPTVLPALATCQVRLKLLRHGAAGPTSLLLTTLSAFQAYAETAPWIRLHKLEFAATPEGHCLIRGTPLPALPGQHWVDHGDFATPAGFHWEPPLAPELVRSWLVTDPGGTVLWHEDQTFSRITEEQWVAAEHSAIRLSKEPDHV